MSEGPGPGFVPWETLAQAGEALDPAVRPLITALNRTGWVRTVFSCAGHPEEPDAVTRGRRQAHVDVLVADPARWRAFVRRVRVAAPAAVHALGLTRDGGMAGAGGAGTGTAVPVSLRVASGSLGAPPPWLRAALRGEDVSRLGRAAPPWWTQLLPDVLAAAPGPDGRRWRYRRLVLEPVPYDLPPGPCRRVLDVALEATLAALTCG